jgi:hypothetical protein
MSAGPSAVVAALVSILLGTGCAVNAAGRTPLEQQQYDFSTQRAIEHAAFFHPGCALPEIKVLRLSDDRRYLELSVCGQVRRYQDLTPRTSQYSAAYVEPTWVDVTATTG